MEKLIFNLREEKANTYKDDNKSEQQTYLSDNSSDDLSDEDFEQFDDEFSSDNDNSNEPDHDWILIWAFKFQERFMLSKVGLYDIDTIVLKNADTNSPGFKCTHTEFPDYPLWSKREPCGSELLVKVPVTDGYIWRPKMVYLLPCLRTQISIMYQSP
ncbi:750_t:CDS:2, partial [Dentiscutata erythropus]